MARHGEVAVKAVSYRQLTIAFNHFRRAPDRDDAPAFVGGGEEFPVSDPLSHHTVGHVVGGEGEALNLQQGAAGRDGRFAGGDAGLAQIGLAGLESGDLGHGVLRVGVVANLAPLRCFGQKDLTPSSNDLAD